MGYRHKQDNACIGLYGANIFNFSPLNKNVIKYLFSVACQEASLNYLFKQPFKKEDYQKKPLVKAVCLTISEQKAKSSRNNAVEHSIS